MFSTMLLRRTLRRIKPSLPIGIASVPFFSSATFSTSSTSSPPRVALHLQGRPALAPHHLLLPSQQYRQFAIKRKWVSPKDRRNNRPKEHITNVDIRRAIGGLDSEVRLIFPDTSFKIMTLRDALIEGDERKLDIILTSRNTKPPICKIIDIGLFKYNIRKKEAEKRKEAPLAKKTVKFKVKIEKGDFSRKVAEARKFLSKGHGVTLAIVLVPRFLAGEERASFLYREFHNAVQDLCVESGKPRGMSTEASMRTCFFHPKPAEELAKLRKEQKAAELEEAAEEEETNKE